MEVRKSETSTVVELFWFENVLWVFIIRPDLTAPHVESNHFHSGEAGQIIDELPYILSRADAIYRASAWGRLSNLICQPLQKYLGTSDRVIMIPHGLFHFLPLHLLLLEGAPLIESHAVVYTPSASVLRFCQKKNPIRSNHEFRPKTITAIGLDFEDEAEIVAQYFDMAHVLTSSRMSITKELILSCCDARDVIHFSAHGEFTPNDPDNSGLILPISGPDSKASYLTLRDVYKMNLNSYLVTLGACSSGIGDYVSGDEILGITRGFFYAGTPSVVASLWEVRNKSTLLLMDRFYSHLLRDGLDKADALRKSQLEVRERFSKLDDWAGFILIGDWL